MEAPRATSRSPGTGRNPAHLVAMEQPKSDPATATVWFDGACPICSREIGFYQGRTGAERIEWIDVSRCGDEALPPGVARSEALGVFHVRAASGELRRGAAGFAALWRALPGFAWVGRLAGSPVVLPLLQGGYALFLKARPLWRGAGARAGQPDRETAPPR